MQGAVEAAAEDAPAAGGPPGGPHGLAVQAVGLQAAPRVHGVPHLRGKHSATRQKRGPGPCSRRRVPRENRIPFVLPSEQDLEVKLFRVQR